MRVASQSIATFSGLKMVGVNQNSPVTARAQQNQIYKAAVPVRDVPGSFTLTIANAVGGGGVTLVNVWDTYGCNEFGANPGGIAISTNTQGDYASLLEIIKSQPYRVGGFRLQATLKGDLNEVHKIFDSDINKSAGEDISEKIIAGEDIYAIDENTVMVPLFFPLDGWIGFQHSVTDTESIYITYNLLGQYRPR